MQPTLFATPKAPHGNPLANIPPWLLRRLDADGVIDLTTGATRKARPAKCAKCHSWIIRGFDADRAALAVDCDPEPLTPEGEALARLTGRWTYTLAMSGGRPELWQRDRWSIAGRPAGTQDGVDILAEHRCPDDPNWSPLPHGPSRLPQPSGIAPLPEEPPF